MSTMERLLRKNQRKNPVEHPAKGSSSSTGAASPSSSDSAFPDLKRLHEFQGEWNAADSYPLRYGVVRRWWPVVVGAEMPDRHVLLLHARIGYELQETAYLVAGLEVPKSVRRNVDAIRDWNIGAMTDNVRRMLKIEIERNPQQQGEDMAKKTAGKVKASKTGVNHLYLEIFEQQARAQLTDLQIQAAIKSKTGSEPTFKNIASYRNAYNNGRLAGQKSCPAKVKAIRPKKEKIKKPMSAETKAKLKAYTETKKNPKIKSKGILCLN